MYRVRFYVTEISAIMIDRKPYKQAVKFSDLYNGFARLPNSKPALAATPKRGAQLRLSK